MKIKRILFSQNRPENIEKSNYAELVKKYGVQLDFFKFFSIEEIPFAEFRKSHINILDYSSIIMTSKNAVDHFFRMVKDSKIVLPISTKYFCSNQSIALYLQKYVTYRKRKIFFPEDATVQSLVTEIEHHQEVDNFLVPCSSDSSLNQLLQLLDAKKTIRYTRAELFKMEFPVLPEHINIYDYDMVVLFSPYGVQALFQSYPDFEQPEHMIIATSGKRVLEMALEAGLKVEVWAPQEPNITSIFTALDQFLHRTNRRH
ncbi:MAG: uroporphyrinogen-III synthase [Bacteroidales bacterium]|nr:uroporphyrinogen-III synthase [Bacteroidales bacterium]